MASRMCLSPLSFPTAKVEQVKFDATTLHAKPQMAAQQKMVDDGSGEVEVDWPGQNMGPSWAPSGLHWGMPWGPGAAGQGDAPALAAEHPCPTRSGVWRTRS